MHELFLICYKIATDIANCSKSI